jgi:hypothetical protein
MRHCIGHRVTGEKEENGSVLALIQSEVLVVPDKK